MSNISQASKNLKKKLSFEDYSKPESQQTDVMASSQAGLLVCQQGIVTATQSADKPAVSTRRQDSMTSRPSKQQAGKQASQPTVTPKLKATFYLSEEDNQSLVEIFIKRLQERNKTDKSALISEAINLLYKREMK